ncbi:MAG: hypothetical protein HY719_04120 [Planctomycetes bacterium]|nr:hypothetical protein [Planctomycetota bacterium]
MRHAIVIAAVGLIGALGAPMVARAGQVVPLHVGASQGKILVKATPRSSYSLQQVTIENRLDVPLAVDLNAESLLPPPGSSSQRVGLGFIRGTNGETAVRLAPRATWTGEVTSVCRDSGRACPTPGEQFVLSATPVTPPERAVLQFWAFNPTLDQSAVNGRVWAINNHQHVGPPTANLAPAGAAPPREPPREPPPTGPEVSASGGQVFVHDGASRLMMYSLAGRWHVCGRWGGPLGESTGTLYGYQDDGSISLYLESDSSWLRVGDRRDARQMISTPAGNLLVLRPDNVLERHDRQKGTWEQIGANVMSISVVPVPGSDDLYALFAPTNRVGLQQRADVGDVWVRATAPGSAKALWRIVRTGLDVKKVEAFPGGALMLRATGEVLRVNRGRTSTFGTGVDDMRAAREGVYFVHRESGREPYAAYVGADGKERFRVKDDVSRVAQAALDRTTGALVWSPDRRRVEVLTPQKPSWTPLAAIPD